MQVAIENLEVGGETVLVDATSVQIVESGIEIAEVDGGVMHFEWANILDLYPDLECNVLWMTIGALNNTSLDELLPDQEPFYSDPKSFWKQFPLMARVKLLINGIKWLWHGRVVFLTSMGIMEGASRSGVACSLMVVDENKHVLSTLQVPGHGAG